MNLLVDMGNTRLKWAVARAGQIMTGLPVLNALINKQDLAELWQAIHSPKRLIISCVSANQLLEQVQSVALDLWPDIDIILVRSQAQAFGVTNAYRQPEKLGVDRWLSLIAVWQQFQSQACIVDCGTAITVDLIDDDGRHLGGLISPGLSLMKRSLGHGTDALPISEISHPFALADYTEAAIYSGTLMAAIGLIEHVLAMQPKNMRLILTGGDAELIAEKLSVASIVKPDLVLQGLLCILEGHL